MQGHRNELRPKTAKQTFLKVTESAALMEFLIARMPERAGTPSSRSWPTTRSRSTTNRSRNSITA